MNLNMIIGHKSDKCNESGDSTTSSEEENGESDERYSINTVLIHLIITFNKMIRAQSVIFPNFGFHSSLDKSNPFIPYIFIL